MESYDYWQHQHDPRYPQSRKDLDTPTATRAYGGRPQRYTSVRFGTCITDILSSDVGTLGFSHTAVNVFDELLTRCCKQTEARRIA